MDMRLENALKLLDPSLSPKQIADIINRLLNVLPLLPHGKIPKANYNLPKPSTKDLAHAQAVCEVALAMAALCINAKYAALAATELGLKYPLIVLKQRQGKPAFDALTHPTVQSEKYPLALIDGCGSLKTANDTPAMYFAKYPRFCKVTYVDAYSLEEYQYELDLLEKGAQHTLFIVNFIHETRHLRGKTAAHGNLVNPEELTQAELEMADIIVREYLSDEFLAQVRKVTTTFQGHGRLTIQYLMEAMRHGSQHMVLKGPKFVETPQALRKLIEKGPRKIK